MRSASHSCNGNLFPSEGAITRASRNLVLAQKRQEASSGDFLLIFLWLRPKGHETKKIAPNFGTRVSLVKVLASSSHEDSLNTLAHACVVQS